MKTKSDLPATELLTIQKLVFLLNDYYLESFSRFLKEENALLSIKLLESVIKNGAHVSGDSICNDIYGKTDAKTKHSFNQLASYTFKMSFFLSRNYPDYLSHNTERIIHAVNNGKVEEANFIAGILLDISQKTCDFQTQIFCLKFLSQQAYVNKDAATGLKHHELLLSVIQNEATYQQLSYNYRYYLNPANAQNFSETELSEKVNDFKAFFNHQNAAIRMYAKFAHLSGLYYFFPKIFESETVYRGLLPETLKEFQNNSYVIFPFFSDLLTFLMFYKINTPFFDFDNRKNLDEFNDWTHHFRSIQFWKHYLNQPEIFAINVKANYYISKYFQFAHKKNKVTYLKDWQKKDIELQLAFCEKLFADKEIEKRFEKYLISIRPIYASLLIIHPDKSSKKAVLFLETLLTSYQQTSFGIIVDNIYTWLMVGYFSMAKYEECIDTFQRYIKTTKGRVYYETNDISIHFYYYLAQWILTGRRQYVKKLNQTFQRAEQLESPHGVKTILKTIAADFEVPVFSNPEN